MRTLSPYLLRTQKSLTGLPYCKVEITPKIGAVPRLDFTRLYEGAEPDYYHAATCPGDDSLIRARIEDVSGIKKLYYQRVVDPQLASDFTVWTYVADTSIAGTALASSGVNVILLWADTDLKTIKYIESSDYGASWGSIQTILTTSNAIYYLSAAMKPNGDVCIFYMESLVITVKAIKRIGGVWGSPDTWTNSLDMITGIAVAYHSDWNLVITGRTAPGLSRGAWACVYGDDGEIVSGAWSILQEIILSDNTYIKYELPSLMWDGNTHRLSIHENYSATQEYKRPFLSFQIPGTLFWADHLWRQPYPFNLVYDFGDSTYSLDIVSSTDYAYLCTPYGVWQAPLHPATLDVTSDVLSLRQLVTHPYPGAAGIATLEVELDNSHLQYADFDKKGCEILVSPGYHTSTGVLVSAGPSFWIEGWEYTSQPYTSTLIIHAIDHWGLFEHWKVPRQISWAHGSTSVKDILTYIMSRVGIALDIIDISYNLTVLKPAFTIHPGESAAAAIRKLLSMVEDVLLFREATAYLRYPQAGDATVYLYHKDGPGPQPQHYLWTGIYRHNALRTNRVQVWGDGLMVDRFSWDDIEDCYDRLRQINDLNCDTVSRAEPRGDAALRQAAIAATEGEIIVPMNCGQELWDVISIEDNRVGFVDRRYRVRGLEFISTTRKGEYRLKIALGGL